MRSRGGETHCEGSLMRARLHGTKPGETHAEAPYLVEIEGQREPQHTAQAPDHPESQAESPSPGSALPRCSAPEAIRQVRQILADQLRRRVAYLELAAGTGPAFLKPVDLDRRPGIAVLNCVRQQIEQHRVEEPRIGL